ncbi:mRNA splicing factor SYF2 [Globomyces pollinis-pini]|nr:mRNA splicing factor SYF2 [Globomyces pollinis-pini]
MDNLKYTIDDVERWDVKQKEKAEKVDRGFTDFAQIAHKKYKNMISEFKPNLNSYEQQKSNTDPQEFYRGVDSLSYADPDHKPSKEAIDRLVHDVEKQTKKRGAFSRRRAFNEDDDVTYINERNMNFNKKIERAYGKYTTEIKANFERGTAL